MSDQTPQLEDLNEVVLGALDLHSSYDVPAIKLPHANRRLVVASGNALPTAKIIFADEPAVFADESSYRDVFGNDGQIDAGVVISASGAKHAPSMIDDFDTWGLESHLITCSPSSTAADKLPAERVIVTKSNREPLTYNTSTYLGMILAKTGEDTRVIKQHLLERVLPLLEETEDIKGYHAFYLIVRSDFDLEREMFVTKFDELFGGRISGRCYTWKQTMHAKTVVPWDKELFISFGLDNNKFGTRRLQIPLPKDAGFAAMLAVGYYVIGYLQSQFPPWFKDHVQAYRDFQEKLFDEESKTS